MESAAEKSYHLPRQVLTKIFADLGLRTLVFGCRLVCRCWKDAVECPDLWKIKIFRVHGHKFETDRALSTAYKDYPWYICYAICNNAFNRNLFDAYEGMPQPWGDTHTSGVMWPTTLNIYTRGFGAVPQELLDEGRIECFLCKYGKNSQYHTVDLYAHGLTQKIMRLQPSIYISEWFAASTRFIAFCHIEVKLYTSDGVCNLESGHFRLVHRIRESQEWYKVSHTFTNYGPDIRYVVFRHGINTRTRNIHPGCEPLIRACTDSASKIAGTKVIVSRPDPSDSASSSTRDS